MKRRESSFGNAFLKPFCFAKAFTENTSWKKRFTLVEIVLVLCSLFLVALPVTVIAAEEDDYVLGIYGNANEDDTIDMRDLTYEKLIFFGKKSETELADAKYDSEINPLDFIQIKLIIVGKEKEITIVDKISSYSALEGQTKERIVTVKKPVNRIIVTWLDSAQILRALNAADKIVGVATQIKDRPPLYPELSRLPSIGSDRIPDFEEILNLQPDIILPGMGGYYKEEYIEKTPGITVVYLSLISWEDYVQSVTKIGYIIDRRDEAEKFLKWRESGLNKIKERTEGLSEDAKPRVLLLSHLKPGGPYKIWAEYNRYAVTCAIAGGKTIRPEGSPGQSSVVDPEWVMEQNPDIIFADTLGIKHGYITDDPSEMAAFREDIMNRPELAKSTAVKNGAVYLCSGDVARDVSGGLILGLYMVKCFHPDLFKDLDPKAIHQEYLTRFQHIDFNVYEDGLFVYPLL
jgi:iron complex transport system substrate-binding protein